MMEEENKKRILEILKETLRAISFDKPELLKDQGDKIIHSATLTQEDNIVSFSVLIYALSKIYSRDTYKQFKSWNQFHKTVINDLNNAVKFLENNEEDEYYNSIKSIFSFIDSLDSKLKVFIKEVFEKAKIHRASRLHEHGISIGRTADILGVSKWELMEYVGKTGINDSEESMTIPMDKRLRTARKIFS
jgi:hypothetical protein